MKKRIVAAVMAGCLGISMAGGALGEDALYGAGLGATKALVLLCETRSGKEAGGFVAHVAALCGAEVAAGIDEILHAQVGAVELVHVVVADGTTVAVVSEKGTEGNPFGWADLIVPSVVGNREWLEANRFGKWFTGSGYSGPGVFEEVSGILLNATINAQGEPDGVLVRLEDGSEVAMGIQDWES